TEQLLGELARVGVATADISPGLEDPAFQNQPYDTHPNSRAHRHFAQALLPHLPPPSAHP
ncbi:MAG: hypothetical protein D6722_20255, partial [Bacteroidetes bacterium]